MKGINIYNADTFEKETSSTKTGIRKKGKLVYVKSRSIGFFHFTHRIKCALEVFNGKADIIRFTEQ